MALSTSNPVPFQETDDRVVGVTISMTVSEFSKIRSIVLEESTMAETSLQV